MEQKKNQHLFEVSWEVCNKVGGIYEVVASKAQHAVTAFHGEYFLLGPDTRHNTEFTETDEPGWDALRYALKDKGMRCRFGRWEIPGRPKVILVDAGGRYDSNQLLRKLWERFGVDSLSGGWDYIEPVLFSYACGEVIAVIHQVLAARDKSHGIAQFHEWMCGAGILALKELGPSIGTVFTTHATVLGRSMAGNGVDIYARMAEISPAQEATRYNVTAKCSMETVSAREADVFTTVSGITAEEARIFLGRSPDIVTDNGLDLSAIHDFSRDRDSAKASRRQMLNPVSRLLRQEVSPDTRIFAISGRYEYHNKGVDLFLDAVASARDTLKNSEKKLLILLLMMGGHTGVDENAAGGNPAVVADPLKPETGFLTSHHVFNVSGDPILGACHRLGLENRVEDNVKLLFVPALLDGSDGFFNMHYFDVLSGCDLGVFPSWYEPWGYTPHECAAYGVPTVTTDLSGFGLWVRQFESRTGAQPGVSIVARRNVSYEKAVEELSSIIVYYATCTEEELNRQRLAARNMAGHASWNEFFGLYLRAYALADTKAHVRRHSSGDGDNAIMNKKLSPRPSSIPFLRTINAVTSLPRRLIRLRDIAANLWWSWQPDAEKLFHDIDAELWEKCGHNPSYLVENASLMRLKTLAGDKDFTDRLDTIAKSLDAYMAQPQRSIDLGHGLTLSADRPIAYFSTEYGLHESLQLYSGGLGVLSGDHLKSASDERIPLVGVGLFYLNGYFQQILDKNGRQTAVYPENLPASLPLEAVLDAKGAPMILSLPLGEHTLYARIWKLQVGLVPLYLMDTNVPENSDDDRRVTARLYEADRDVRLRQEILLGMGGVRMLAMLGIIPSVWHMNEGHSAFLVLERLRQHISGDSLSLAEAKGLVRSSCVFTTHTPVDAGNERFSADLMSRYFPAFTESIGMEWGDFLHLGRQDGGDQSVFDMTVLALRMSSHANAVSSMHGMVSRRMWHNIWRGFDEAELPISHVTNGIHMASYAGASFRPLLERWIGKDWAALHETDARWKQVQSIPDADFWSARLAQKQALIEKLRIRLPKSRAYSSIPAEHRPEWLSALSPETLIIGFARRFAPYKRATMIFADPDRLARLLNNPDRPVAIVMAGKSHPADGMGIGLIEETIRWSLDPRFKGKIFFVENYNLEVSRLLAQGCDVWLNTPRRPYEASGTSGEKVPVNGGLNLSISDGWWVEGDNGSNGWTIGPKAGYTTLSAEQNDYEDAEQLYMTLEEKVIPLFFSRDESGLPCGWLQMAKNSLQSLVPMYSSRRMVRDYMEKIYIPAARRGAAMDADRQEKARFMAEWLRTVPGRFNTAVIQGIELEGVNDDSISCGEPFKVRLELLTGEMKPEELKVQFVIGPTDGTHFTAAPEVVDLIPV
ncbi:MAG: alpha-glucan family phosphorylase, partial [Mailhella sp.]|nr:alpha-glucan family phosphorylase [Mailhella sp.]